MFKKNSSTMRQILLAAVATLLLNTPVAAWGNRGHQIIGRIAMSRLTPSARQAMAELLAPGETVENVAGWADQIKAQRLETRSWHVVAIALSESRYLRSRDCGRNETCIIDALNEQTTILKDTTKDFETRAEALKFVIHLVGDLHQPYHIATNTKPHDLGANKVKVTALSGRVTSLHDVWDTDLVEFALKRSARSVGEYANQLSKKYSGASTRSSVSSWALESHKYAWDGYYFTNGDFMVADERSWRLDEAYYNKNLAIVEKQLALAGLRLAKTLNDIFGSRKSDYK